jgi:SAM-dependent methyltransferase
MGDELPLESHLHAQLEVGHDFFWHRVRWRAVSAYLPAGEAFELVDYGAGAGTLGRFLGGERPLATYRFVEPMPSLRGRLRATFGPGADASDADGFPDARYVALLDVLEHQRDDREFMRQLVRRMRPQSLLLLTVPALQALWSGWDVALGHWRRYDRRSLAKCLEGMPLKLIEISYLFPEMLPVALFRRWRSPPGRAPSGGAEFPNLSPRTNAALTAIGSLTVRLRRYAPAGTSLLLVARCVAEAGG